MSENHKCCEMESNRHSFAPKLTAVRKLKLAVKLFLLRKKIKCKYQKKMKMIKRYDIKSVQVFEMSKKENDGLLS